jgi:hypothetical protein
VWTDGGATPTYKEWGAGMGVSLNADAAGTKSAYAGAAQGLNITTSGTIPAGTIIRYQVKRAVDDAAMAPFVEFTAVGAHNVKFADATCLYDWMVEQGCTTTGGPYDVQIQLAGGEVSGDFNFCIDSIVPIL